jgi:LysR family transcriptional regulator, glycine cleavage system transcriptional activator
MPHLPLNALRAFEAVARTGSFKAAAEALFVTQSAISHQVRHLETWLGAPLFDRTSGRPSLLPSGEDLARAVALSLTEIDAACQRARVQPRIQPIVIAAIPSVAVCWLIPRLSDFRACHPDVEIRVVYALHGKDVDFRDVHLAFVYGEGQADRPGVVAEVFLPGAAVPVCSPALMQGRAAHTCSAQDMLELGLLHDTNSSGWQEWMRRQSHKMPPQLTGPIFEDFNLLRAAALSGQGVALCPLAMIRPDLDAGRLVQLSASMVHEGLSYHLLAGPLTEGPMKPAVNAFLDWARAARDGAIT